MGGYAQKVMMISAVVLLVLVSLSLGALFLTTQMHSSGTISFMFISAAVLLAGLSFSRCVRWLV